MNKPRTMRELEALPIEEATEYWESLSDEQKVKLMNAMTTEEINAMSEDTLSFRNSKVTTLKRALAELESMETADGKFIYNGDGAEPFELTPEYCTKHLTRLKKRAEGETEESLGFFGYHNIRLWTEAYQFLLNEYQKRGEK